AGDIRRVGGVEGSAIGGLGPTRTRRPGQNGPHGADLPGTGIADEMERLTDTDIGSGQVHRTVRRAVGGLIDLIVRAETHRRPPFDAEKKLSKRLRSASDGIGDAQKTSRIDPFQNAVAASRAPILKPVTPVSAVALTVPLTVRDTPLKRTTGAAPRVSSYSMMNGVVKRGLPAAPAASTTLLDTPSVK